MSATRLLQRRKGLRSPLVHVRRLRQLTSGRLSMSQEGEDILLEKLNLFDPSSGFIEIGGFHPFRFSNTARLYRYGGNGLIVEPNSVMAAKCRRGRPRDFVVEAAVDAHCGEGILYGFEQPAFNTMSEAQAKLRQHEGHRIVSQNVVDLITLEEVVELYVSQVGLPCSLLSIDIEGLDVEVLSQLKELSFRPRVLVFESLCPASSMAAERVEVARQQIPTGYEVRSILGGSVVALRCDESDG